MLDNLIENSYSAAAYAGVRVVLMAVSFVVIDALTPGRLSDHLWGARNRNAAVLVSSTWPARRSSWLRPSSRARRSR